MAKAASLLLTCILMSLFLSPMAFAEEGKIRVTLTPVPGSDGGEEQLLATLSELAELDVRPSDWFFQQVRARAFQTAGVTERPNDMMWVMQGSDIALVIAIVVEDDNEFAVRFHTDEEGKVAHEFHVDRGEAGLTRGAVRLIGTELERFLGIGTVSAAATTQAAAPQEQTVAEDPETMRRRAAEAEAALAERLSRDWLWARAHFRLFNKHFTVAGTEAVSSFNSSSFPGFELDIEAFPFVLSNTDMVEPGLYVTYNHGFDRVTLVNPEEGTEEPLSINNFSLEGGLIYRLDSPLDESMQQVRLKLGARYDSFSLGENPVLPSTSIVSAIIGARVVLPVMVDNFAIAASVDIVPFAFFQNGAELFGQNSFSYGFGSELGFVYQVIDNLYLSAGYTFRVIRSNFDGEGASEFAYVDSDVFDLNQGLRAGIIFQY